MVTAAAGIFGKPSAYSSAPVCGDSILSGVMERTGAATAPKRAAREGPAVALLEDAFVGQRRSLKLAGDVAIAKHEHTVAQMGKILVLGARDDHRRPVLGGVADQREDLLSRADVHALRDRLLAEDLTPLSIAPAGGMLQASGAG